MFLCRSLPMQATRETSMLKDLSSSKSLLVGGYFGMNLHCLTCSSHWASRDMREPLLSIEDPESH